MTTQQLPCIYPVPNVKFGRKLKPSVFAGALNKGENSLVYGVFVCFSVLIVTFLSKSHNDKSKDLKMNVTWCFINKRDLLLLSKENLRKITKVKISNTFTHKTKLIIK